MRKVKTDLKRDMAKRRLTIGSWLTIADAGIAEIMAEAGFDWLAIDMEHSAITLYEAEQLIRIVELSGVAPLVRVGENSPGLIKRVMDAGAHGVIVPMVNNRSDAMKAVDAVKYPPVGTRGVGLARAQRHGLEFERYKVWVNRKSIVVAQIEHKEAIDNLEEILTVPGVDGSIIGPYDLSASLGFPGKFDRKDVKEAIKRYLNVCGRLGCIAGFHSVPPHIEKAAEAVKAGFRFIGFSLDALFLGEKVREELRKFRMRK